MLTVGPFEMETEAGSVCAHITHSGAQSLSFTAGGWRRMEEDAGCRRGVGSWRGGDGGVSGSPAVCRGTGQLQLTGGPIHAIR